MKLNEIWEHLNAKEFPTADGKWAKTKIEPIESISVLSHLIMQAASEPTDDNNEILLRIKYLDDIERTTESKLEVITSLKSRLYLQLGVETKEIELSLWQSYLKQNPKPLIASQSLLEESIKMRNWFEILFCIENNFLPKEGCDELAKEALKNGQFSLVKELIKRRLVEKFDDEFLKTLISKPMFSAWRAEIFILMTAQGLSLKTSLEFALQMKNYHLAALIISQGEKIESHALEEALTHYADCLNTGTESEKELKRYLTPKNIAHFLGDSIVEGMDDDSGQPLGGNVFHESLSFFRALLRVAIDEYPSQSEQLTRLKDQIEEAQNLALKLASINSLKEDQKIFNGLKIVEREIVEKIDRLEVGDTFIIPTGWITGDQAHAIIMRCTRISTDRISVEIINTGEGTEYHAKAFDKARLHINTVRRHELSNQEFLGKIFRIIEPTAVHSQSRRYFTEDLYGAFDPFLQEEQGVVSEHWRKAQVGPTCSLRCLLALSKISLAQSYKPVKWTLSLRVLNYAILQNQKLLPTHPQLNKLLDLSLQSELVTVIKPLGIDKTALVNSLITLSKILKEATPKAVSVHNRLISYPPSNQQIPSYLTPFKISPHAVSQKASFPITGTPLSVFNIQSITKSEELIPILEQLLNHLELNKTLPSSFEETYLCQILIEVGRAYFSSLIVRPQSYKNFIATIDKYSLKLSKFSIDTFYSPAFFIANQYALFIAFDLACRIADDEKYPLEAKPQTYGLFTYYQRSEVASRQWIIIDPELEKDLLNIKVLSKKHQTKGSFSGIFNYFSMAQMEKGDLYLSLQPKNAQSNVLEDYQFAEVLSKTISDWSEADKEYEEATAQMRRLNKTPNLKIEQWRTHWFYLNRLPPHLEQLKRVSLLAYNSYIGGPRNFSQLTSPRLKLIESSDRTASNEVVVYFLFRPPGVEFIRINSILNPLPQNSLLKIEPTDEKPMTLCLYPKRGYNRICQQFKSSVDKELMGVRFSVTSCDTPIGLPLLLDFFRSLHPQNLDKLEYRLLFEFTLFSPSKLNLALKSVPDFIDQTKNFFEDAIAIYEERLSSKLDLSSSAKTVIFLLTQWQRILLYLRQENLNTIGRESIASLLEKVKEQLLSKLSSENYQTNPIQQHIYLSLIESSTPNDLILYKEAYQRLIDNDQVSNELSPLFTHLAIANPIKQSFEIHEALLNDTFRNKTLNQIAKNYDSTSVPGVWKEKAFPLYECVIDKDLYQIDVLKGLFFKNGKPPLPLTYSMRQNSPSYRELFGQKLLLTYGTDTIFHAKDSFGPIKIYTNDSSIYRIEREIKGNWYTHIAKGSRRQYIDHPPFSYEGSLSYFSLSSNPSQFIAIDLATYTPILAIDQKGHITFLQENNNIKWMWVDKAKANNPFIWSMDKWAFLLQSTDGKNERLLFPRLMDDSFQPLQLEKRENGAWQMLSKPHLIVSETQQLYGFRNFDSFLILENSLGEKEALIPIKTMKEHSALTTTNTTMMSIKFKDEKVTSCTSYPYLSYLQQHLAKTVDDYIKTIGYLQKAYKFERYSDEELRLLGQIFRNTKDKTAQALAIRLFAGWLVIDNLKRNPIELFDLPSKELDILEEESPASEWRIYWEENHPKCNFKNELSQLALSYFSLQSKLPFKLRISSLLSPQELLDFGLGNFLSNISSPEQKIEEKATITDDIINFLKKMPGTAKAPPYIFGRPAEMLKTSFRYFLQCAKDPQREYIARNQLEAMRFDPDPTVKALSTILALVLKKNKETLQWLDDMDDRSKLQDFKRAFHLSDPYFSPIKVQKGVAPALTIAEILPPIKEVNLPNTIPKKSPLTFKVRSQLDFQALFEKHFQEDEIAVTAPFIPFDFKSDDPWISKNIKLLNQDCLKGNEKNGRTAQYRVKLEMKPISVPDISNLSQEIELLANQEINKNLAQIASLQKLPLSIRDAIGLFLVNDLETYRQATGLNDDEIQKLHQLIADHILEHNEAHRINEINEALKNNQVQTVAAYLKVKNAIDYKQDPLALMVFEYALNLSLKEHQVQGLRDMMQPLSEDRLRFKSVLLQRIQGGGKSLVFGHIIALLKADGYHLSIHVPATSQYPTAIYDMKGRSEKLFGQRERTFTFDDSPLKFTKDYLTWTYNMLKEVIVTKGYISITNESLRALRGKYLKARQEIRLSRGNLALEESTQHLKALLRLLRERAIITFDEFHLTVDPFNDLDMPYGPPRKLDKNEASLLAKILRYALLASSNDRPLIDIMNSRLAALNPETMKMVKRQVIESLLKEPFWNKLNIKEYLEGGPFPDRLTHHKEAPLIILARQMLAGDWLQERLSFNINEHHGLSKEGISIPFIGNGIPSEESEFSDRHVLMLNTFIAYLGIGLNLKQTKECIEYLKSAAQLDRKVKSTATLDLFQKGTGLNLLEIDLEKDLEKVQRALKSPNDAAREIILNYVMIHEIEKVELYDTQVSTNGQNEATMGQSFVAYTASTDNPQMAPIGTQLYLEEGTNGQTIDLLIRQKTPVVTVNENLLDQLKNPKIHAIMDISAYFRGISNEAVAKMIAEKLVELNSLIKGVLYFNRNGNLCHMSTSAPHAITLLTSTEEQLIKMETGHGKESLFTYYDQFHTTGMDIAQDPDAIGLATVNEQTPIPKFLQGVRRLRGLDLNQKIIVALPQEAIKPIQSTLKSDKPLQIQEVLLHASIKQIGTMKEENRPFCLLKLENVVQQYIIDKLLNSNPEEEKTLFNQCYYLFEKKVYVDLINEFAFKRKSISIEDYFKTITDQLLAPLKGASIDVSALEEIIYQKLLTKETYEGLDKTVEVRHDFGKTLSASKSIDQTRTSTVLVTRQAQNLEVSQAQNLQQVQFRAYNDMTVFEDKPFKDELLSQLFGNILGERGINPGKPCLWRLNDLLGIKVDKNLLITSNAAQSCTTQLDLIGPHRKSPYFILLISDTNGKDKEWKTVICSISDAIDFWTTLERKPTLPVGRQYYLLTGSGTPVTNPKPQEDENLSKQLVQAIYFSGDYETLSFGPRFEQFQQWAKDVDKKTLSTFFENSILCQAPPTYFHSPLYKFFKL